MEEKKYDLFAAKLGNAFKFVEFFVPAIFNLRGKRVSTVIAQSKQILNYNQFQNLPSISLYLRLSPHSLSLSRVQSFFPP